MDALYHQTNRLLQEVAGEDLGRVERLGEDPCREEIEKQVENKLANVNSNCSRLDMLVNKEPPQRRSSAKYRVDQLKYDYQHILNSLRVIQQRRTLRKQQELERAALLSRSFTTNDAPRDTAISLDHTLQHHSRLESANRNVDQMLDAGNSVMEGLRHQGSVMKGAHRKLMDLTSTLGMSNTIMRLIERRGAQDKYILFAGMFIVLLLLYLLLRYF
uniref:Golgi SNAP receptor complex member 2-like n=1 Tax=Hirondellea gigas TaxID=1518452 RepID=A0A2P2IA96_9CRUS